MASSQVKRPKEDLKKASEVVLYELQMMHAAIAAERITRGSVFGNACLESALVHIRNLHYFFYKEPKKNDLVAGHFFDSLSQWERIRPPRPVFFQDESKLDIVHRFLAHMTWNRVTEDKPKWDLVEIARQLLDPMSTLVAAVRDDHLCEALRLTVKEMKESVD